MFRAYMVSFLARQYLVLKKDFDLRYPFYWLVWEPGAWTAPPAKASVADTRLPYRVAPAKALPGDALCFELAVKPDRKDPVRIGRADENELVITDATVSRDHCTLRIAEAKWYVRASAAVKSMKLDGQPLAAGAEAPLSPGGHLDLGEVKLTFLDPPSFVQRIATHAQRL